MTRRPRIFPSHLSRLERVVYGAATFFFVALFAALIWPVYPLFAGIRPLVLGVPLSLAYVVALLLLGFAVLLALFVWEGRRPSADGAPHDPSRKRAGASPSPLGEGGKGIEGLRG